MNLNTEKYELTELSAMSYQQLVFALLIAKEAQTNAIKNLDETKQVDNIMNEMKARREKERQKNQF